MLSHFDKDKGPSDAYIISDSVRLCPELPRREEENLEDMTAWLLSKDLSSCCEATRTDERRRGVAVGKGGAL